MYKTNNCDKDRILEVLESMDNDVNKLLKLVPKDCAIQAIDINSAIHILMNILEKDTQ